VKGVTAIMERAKASGVIDAVAADAKDELAEHYCLSALMANALYERTSARSPRRSAGP